MIYGALVTLLQSRGTSWHLFHGLKALGIYGYRVTELDWAWGKREGKYNGGKRNKCTRRNVVAYAVRKK
jgi:hypothetical protein